MPLTGKLNTWNDDRGFGFIAPTHGGRELFVHVSAFPRDGSRPTVGESLEYELGRGKDGKPAAVRVHRRALGSPQSYPSSRPTAAARRRSPLTAIIGLMLVLGVGAFAFSKYQAAAQRRPSATFAAPVPSVPSMAPAPSLLAEPSNPPALPTSFRCDGRLHCSQMTSCAEAKLFLKNCSGTKMDSDNDGIPCEEQWCTGPFGK
jgi:cold shock CspA family protein